MLLLVSPWFSLVTRADSTSSYLQALRCSWSRILACTSLPVHIPALSFPDTSSWVVFSSSCYLLGPHFITAHWTGCQSLWRFIGNLGIWLSVKWKVRKWGGPLRLQPHLWPTLHFEEEQKGKGRAAWKLKPIKEGNDCNNITKKQISSPNIGFPCEECCC